MVDRHLSDRQLDDAIDRAVRDLMRVEPRADLRARVLAELEAAPARLTPWPRLAVGGAVLALAAILLALLLPRPAERIDDARIAHTRPPSAPTETAPAPISPAPDRGPATASFGNHARRPAPVPDVGLPARERGATDRLIQAASIDTLDRPDAAAGDATSRVERLAPLDPIRISTLDSLDMSTPDIVMTPITVGAIDIAPLTPQR
jgi:hypothetical protein